MKKLIYLIVVIAALGLIVSGCLPVVPPAEQNNIGNLTKANVNPGESIQAAINVANPGDTIIVAAGEYTEQVNIEKSLTIIGAGQNNTHIVSPSPTDMTIYDQFGSKNTTSRYIYHRGTNIPVVRIAASDVTFEGFHVDLDNQEFFDVQGSGTDSTYSKGVGILVDHVETTSGTPDEFTGITIQDNKIDGLLWDDYSDGIKVMAQATVNINDNIIYGYGESAISAQGMDSPRAAYYPTVTANNNILYGGSNERSGNHYFFGIGFWSGATGSADGNTIYNAPNNNGYALNSWTPNSVSFTNNIITTDGGSVGGCGAQLYESSDLTFSDNDVQSQGLAGAIWDGNYVDPIVTITNNEIINCIDGFIGDGLTVGTVAIHYNNFEGIADNHYALDMKGHGVSIWGTADPCTITADATCNWWGDESGPYHSTNLLGTGNPVSDKVDFAPWLGGVIESIEISPNPAAQGTPTELIAIFTGPTETTATIDWGDGTPDSTTTVSNGKVTDSHTYAEAGVYTVVVTLSTICGFSDPVEFQYAVVYDPSAGFVTGGGWIDSPAGASTEYPDAVGKASFGFVSKYKKGATVPTGKTEFQFKAGDLNFHSDSYDWLVIAHHKAMYKGTGTINGSGEYGFMLSAIDEELTPSTDVDLFRIKIWDKDTGDPIYDNQMDDDDNADPTTEIGGGQIVIHNGK